MKLSTALVAAATVLPSVSAWGGFGHITIAYLASDFVPADTATYFQTLLHNQTADYLAGVATWADSIRYTKWGHFTGPFHFIDAKDSPPERCDVDMERDCKAAGCIVTALQNYTARLIDSAASSSLSPLDREQAAKFVVHFVGDIHQPLHAEDVARGGNGIRVTFDGAHLNLHHVWDTSIAEKLVGGVRRQPYAAARRWADVLAESIRGGAFHDESEHWLNGLDLADPAATALAWARESNGYVCSHVFPQGPTAIRNQELGSDYYEKAAPVIEIQIARAGIRLAAYLDRIAAQINQQESATGEL
ncbi:nuclease s1 [Grosmannia clavigera kw1407]|uniref:Nuclease s1 n=1 Tax=Grosmannia clavigera (strain kw1407 / UAMH 11150) TaxID=655863 RepID=F0XJ37_GROCL|nr:nuclease s1 [Grosmannia clavigera kw1407]EFX02221.1 nuclease s1 [Grosmannia clavigera kw1407]